MAHRFALFFIFFLFATVRHGMIHMALIYDAEPKSSPNENECFVIGKSISAKAPQLRSKFPETWIWTSQSIKQGNH